MKTALLQEIDPLGDPRWDDAVDTCPGATAFHSSAWARVLADAYGYRPHYLACLDGEVVLVPLMEINSVLTGRRAVCLPFTDVCPVLTSGDVAHEHILEQLIGLAKRSSWKSFAIRDHALAPGKPTGPATFCGHRLDLTVGKTVLHEQLRNSTQRNIKKAEREDVKVTRSTSVEAMNAFYRLQCMTRKRHGLPPQPLRFFLAIQKHLLEQGRGTIAIASHEGNAIAGAVYLHHGKQALFKYGASDSRAQHLRPNDLVMWSTIAYLAEEGFDSLDFGRTDLVDAGLRHFKEGWGAQEYPIRYIRYEVGRDIFTEQRAGSGRGWSKEVFRRMPIPALRLVGSLLYKHVG